MRKIIAGINMTLDGVCDHTAINPDEEIHNHYTDLLKSAGVVLYGRITYQLMQFWQDLLKHPSGEKSMDEFAVAMNEIPKIVFSHTLPNTGWKTATLADLDIKEQVLALKKQPGKDILIGSRSLIMQLLKLNLIDEFQLCIHPVVAGSGLRLFEDMSDRKDFRLANTRVFGAGAVVLYYELIK